MGEVYHVSAYRVNEKGKTQKITTAFGFGAEAPSLSKRGSIANLLNPWAHKPFEGYTTGHHRKATPQDYHTIIVFLRKAVA